MKHASEYHPFVIAARLTVVVLFLLVPLRGAIAQLAPPERWSAPTSTVLISSVFAAGTGGRPMTSANYRMLGTMGEAALPNNSTTLSSASYRLLPGFLAALPGGPVHVYVPVLMCNYIRYFQGPNEVEENDTPAEANGPLQSNVYYHGYQDDNKDYFSFYMFSTGSITVALTNTSGLRPQLLLYYQDDLKNSIQYAPNPPFYLALSNRQPGWYYIEVYTAGDFNSNHLYNLLVQYPLPHCG